MKTDIKTYQDAKKYLGNKKERPYANNTRIEIDTLNLGHEVITIKYHGNPIVNFFPDGTITYNSCGWKTITTKERINWFLPDGFKLYQHKSTWYISEYMNRSWLFADGITIKNGQVYNAGTEDNTKNTIKSIKQYVNGYIKALLNKEIGQPSGVDCWYCLLKNEKGNSIGGNNHILSHFEESYYVPSMLINAYKHNNRLSLLAQDGIARLAQGESISDWQADIMGRDVKTCLTSYLKHVLGIAQ